MLLPLAALACGSALLLSGAELLIRGAKNLALIFKLSPLFISLTLVAFGTSLPELTVSSIATANHDPGLAFGNILGSNITNSTLILGMAVLAGSLRIGTTKTQRNAWLLLGITAIFILTQIFPQLPTSPGSLLIGIAIGITLLEYWYAAKGRLKEDFLKIFPLPPLHQKPPSLTKTTFITASGILILILGGNLLVVSTQLLSHLLDISTTTLGLTLTSLVTSLPELATTLIAQKKGEEKIAIGNILGSNLYNLTFIGGLITLKPSTSTITPTEIYFLILSSFILFAIIKVWKGKSPPAKLGTICIVLFAIYTITIYALP